MGMVPGSRDHFILLEGPGRTRDHRLRSFTWPHPSIYFPVDSPDISVWAQDRPQLSHLLTTHCSCSGLCSQTFSFGWGQVGDSAYFW